MTSAQCRAARALVEMDQAHLAEVAKVSRNVVVDFEKGRRMPIANNLAALRRTLEAAGVIFIDPEGGGAGVRLKTLSQDQGLRPEDLNASNDD